MNIRFCWRKKKGIAYRGRGISEHMSQAGNEKYTYISFGEIVSVLIGIAIGCGLLA